MMRRLWCRQNTKVPARRVAATLVVVVVVIGPLPARGVSTSPSSSDPDEAATEVAADAREPPPRIFLGIKSSTVFAGRRETWRRSRCAERYASLGATYKFFVGVPLSKGHDLTAHNQGDVATEEEREVSDRLLAEFEAHGDLEFLPYRDQYMDLSNKVLSILRFAVDKTQASYVGVQDDDFCLDLDAMSPAALQRLAGGSSSNRLAHQESRPALSSLSSRRREVWVGSYRFNGTEYPSMRGPTNLVAPYFSGCGYVLSRALVEAVLTPGEFARAVLSMPYGTSAEDANMGKWVQRAAKRGGFEVDMIETGFCGPQLKPPLSTAAPVDGDDLSPSNYTARRRHHALRRGSDYHHHHHHHSRTFGKVISPDGAVRTFENGEWRTEASSQQQHQPGAAAHTVY